MGQEAAALVEAPRKAALGLGVADELEGLHLAGPPPSPREQDAHHIGTDMQRSTAMRAMDGGLQAMKVEALLLGNRRGRGIHGRMLGAQAHAVCWAAAHYRVGRGLTGSLCRERRSLRLAPPDR